MEHTDAARLVLEHANSRSALPGDELVLVPHAMQEKPYPWVFQLQSRRYVETGDEHAMLVGQGPTVVLHDGSVHTLGTARPTAEELYAFEVAHGLPVTADRAGAGAWETGDLPMWVGAQEGARFPVLALSDAGLEVERRDDLNISMRFATPADRDRALTDLHRLLAPTAPVEQLRRPTRQFVELAGLGVLVLAIGLALPWMVETGQIDRTHWLIAGIFNVVGPAAFRLAGIVLATGFFIGLVAITVNNPLQAGFKIRRAAR